jgi:hypothetical protein
MAGRLMLRVLTTKRYSFRQKPVFSEIPRSGLMRTQ